MTITTTQYKSLDEAYVYFNEKLFDGKLPDVIINFERKPKMAGIHRHKKFQSRNGNGNKISELALNPDTFRGLDDLDILDTLVHEMVHHWQFTFGEPSRAGYHDREWAAKMKEIGLYPSSTGEVGGKETGQSMSDYIIDGGKFEIVAKAFLLNGSKIYWDSIVVEKEKKKRKKTRYKYTCPTCMVNMWGKKDANIVCGDCMEKMIVEEDD